MIQCAARRACATSLKKGRLCQWRVSGNARPPCRSRSAGPIAASEVWSNPERGSSIVSASIQEQERERERDAADEKDAESMETEHMFDRTPTALGRDVGRMVRSNQDFLQPEVRLLTGPAQTLADWLSEHTAHNPYRRQLCRKCVIDTLRLLCTLDLFRRLASWHCSICRGLHTNAQTQRLVQNNRGGAVGIRAVVCLM